MKKRIFALLLVLVMMLGLVACGEKEETTTESTSTETTTTETTTTETTTETTETTEEVEVEYEIQWYGGSDLNGYRAETARLFEEAYPQYKVNVVEMDGNDTQQQLMTMIAAGEVVDVVWDSAEPIMNGGIAGTYLPLNEYLEADGIDYVDYFGELCATAATYNGEIYGIPKYYNTFKVFYNKTMTDAAGITIPTDGWSWDEFLATAQALNDPDNGVYGCVFPSTWCDIPVNAALCAGWTYTEIDANGNVTPNFDDPRLEESLTLARDLAFVHEVSPSYDTIKAESLNRRVYLATQQTAMICDGPYTFIWMQNYMFNDPGEGVLDFEVGVAEMPYIEGGENCSFADVVGLWGIPKTSGNPQAAFRFAMFIETGDPQLAVYNTAYLSTFEKWEEMHGVTYSELNNMVMNTYTDLDGNYHEDFYPHELVDALTTIPKEFHDVYWNYDARKMNPDSLMYTLFDEQYSLFFSGEMDFAEWAAYMNDLGAEQLAANGLSTVG